jgi:hypothetical protein
VQLLVTAKECQPRIVGDEIEGEFLEAAQHHDILDHTTRRLAADMSQLKTVPMQMERMNVIARVSEF